MRRFASLAAAVVLGACAAGPPRAPSADGPAAGAASVALPAGAGRGILERKCTGCHDLGGLSAYRGYYNEARWRDMIVTMVGHGAELDEAEIATLTRYLVEHFGPGTREQTTREGEE